ncbi:MAG: hypothetical protein K2M48_01020 [Clostridiales bacterium]|nr:hypothetical protein [Clostridiales bacterium]
MFELKYKITDADFKTVNKSLMWQFFIPYVIVALLGIAAGIAAITLRPGTEMLVLGIILIVLAAVLLVCAVLMAIAPKNFVASALLTSDDTERTFEIGDDGITIKTPEQKDINVGYNEILRVRDKKTYALLYVDKAAVVLLKDEIVSGGTYAELIAFLKGKTQNATAQPPAAEGTSEKAETPAPAVEEPATETVEEPAPEAEEAKEDTAE